MDQPTAEKALEELEVLVGEWDLEATGADGERWPGKASLTFEWLEGSDKRLLLERATVEMPEAPDTVCVIGADASSGRYFQLYTDSRNVCRVYEMSIGNGEWKIWREGEPFDQRLNGTIADDGETITARWELNEGDGWRTDFDLVFRRVT